jgi:DNA repair exonuclease SbcCD ATPase subunit
VEAIAQAQSFLPPSWQDIGVRATPSDLAAWQAEQAELESKRIDERIGELHAARAGREALERARFDLVREIDSIPDEAKRLPGDIAGIVAELRHEQELRDEALDRARQEHRRLLGRQEQRQCLRERFQAVNRQQTLYRTLAEHLGCKGLQLHLMRQAEKGIVDFSNAVLDRLSGGQFCLRLRSEGEGDADQALDLEAFDRLRRQVFAIPFLSGSQRFRVAVSLALGVGQYASRQQRPIESVIIDEGFGCLDREGRQVMIQELQNLRTQLRCILLVSHQEEFADAFADGYRFELTNGSTSVTRFQR